MLLKSAPEPRPSPSSRLSELFTLPVSQVCLPHKEASVVLTQTPPAAILMGTRKLRGVLLAVFYRWEN